MRRAGFFPRVESARLRIRLLEGVVSLQNAAAEEEIRAAIDRARPIGRSWSRPYSMARRGARR
jgi:hypothetical protein